MHPDLARLVKARYVGAEIQRIFKLLSGRGTFEFERLENGLFPAAGVAPGDISGYHHVWVRDNVFVADALFRIGRVDEAASTARALAAFYRKHAFRFADIIEGRRDPSDPMVRPHVRFDGERLAELDEHWAHAQNDALGYFLWLHCQLARAKVVETDLALYTMFARYFEAIRFWEDEDSGHWEETRRVRASSIGVVTGALRTLPAEVGADRLVAEGEAALEELLPAESEDRRYDAALIFLVHPIGVVGRADADQILRDVTECLQGEHGIRRYLGDSYWAPDYKKHLDPGERTRDFSDNLASRDLLLIEPGVEAQWCIFDPMLACAYAERGDAHLADAHLNRSLSQLTDDLRCPEAYYFEAGRWVPNDHTPLLWSQANLLRALHLLEHRGY